MLYKFNKISLINNKINLLKGPRGMTLTCFCFVLYEAVYPTHYDFIILQVFRFLKTFPSIFIRMQGRPKYTMCTPKGWLNVSTALCHMLMQSA